MQSPEGAEILRPAAVFVFKTSVEGIFAAGDARDGSTKQVASAVGEGAAASLAVRHYLETIGEARHVQVEMMGATAA